jgi:hypothetical protein
MLEHPAHPITTISNEDMTMTTDQLKPLADQLTRLCTLYESTVQLMNEHEPQTHILDNLNGQFRAVLDELDQQGVMS